MAGEVFTGTTGLSAILKFFREFLDAPSDADILVRSACAIDDPARELVVVTLNRTNLTMPPGDARKMADIAEETMREFNAGPGTQGLAELAMALRATADRISKGPSQ